MSTSTLTNLRTCEEEECGRKFVAHTPWQKYCSKACRQRAYRKAQRVLLHLGRALTLNDGSSS